MSRKPNARAFSTDIMRGEWKAAREPLNRQERARRLQLEAVIERGLATFFEVSAALHEMRASRLYRDTHATFVDYCQQRWGFSASRARQLISAGVSVTMVTQSGLLAPTSERVARELVPLRHQPERLCEAWRQALEEHGPEPTAVQVRRIVRALLTFAPDPVDVIGIVTRESAGGCVTSEAVTAEAQEQLRQLSAQLQEVPLERIRQIRTLLGWCVELRSQRGHHPTHLPLRVRRHIVELVSGWTRGLKESEEILGLDGCGDWRLIARICAAQDIQDQLPQSDLEGRQQKK
jgi:hypothetical protein